MKPYEDGTAEGAYFGGPNFYKALRTRIRFYALNLSQSKDEKNLQGLGSSSTGIFIFLDSSKEPVLSDGQREGMSGHLVGPTYPFFSPNLPPFFYRPLSIKKKGLKSPRWTNFSTSYLCTPCDE